MMKALSIRQPWASMVTIGKKTVETRSWRTSYRGRLLIQSATKPDWDAFHAIDTLPDIENYPMGHALALVDLVDCRPMTLDDEKGALCELFDGAWAWLLRRPRVLTPWPMKGKQGLFTVDYEEGP